MTAAVVPVVGVVTVMTAVVVMRLMMLAAAPEKPFRSSTPRARLLGRSPGKLQRHEPIHVYISNSSYPHEVEALSPNSFFTASEPILSSLSIMTQVSANLELSALLAAVGCRGLAQCFSMEAPPPRGLCLSCCRLGCSSGLSPANPRMP